MKVFLSWSGEKSKRAAEAFNDWLPCVINAISPFYSAQIPKGANWNSALNSVLSDVSIGIFFVTKDNMTSPWLFYEAGILSAARGQSSVFPFLVDMGSSELTGPLSQFQSTVFDKQDIYLMMKALNSACGANAISSTIFDRSFNRWYPELEQELQAILYDPSYVDTSIKNELSISSQSPDSSKTANIGNNFGRFVNSETRLIEDLFDGQPLSIGKFARTVEDTVNTLGSFKSFMDSIDDLFN